jgi:hypothetical protein
MGLPPANYKTAEEVDAGSRYGTKETKAPSMHHKDRFSQDETIKARKEATRLSKKSQQKWIDAIERGEMVRVTQLLDDGQDINEVCAPQMSTGLYVAARTNNLRMAELLLKRGADPAVLTDDLVSPAWISISRGFDQMRELLRDPKWNASLVKVMKEETRVTLQEAGAGVQETHYELAVMRRYYRCVYMLEQALGKDESKIPPSIYELPPGWAMGFQPAESGQRIDMPMKPFYWKAFSKGACYDDPPEGSKELKHQGDGTFA